MLTYNLKIEQFSYMATFVDVAHNRLLHGMYGTHEESKCVYTIRTSKRSNVRCNVKNKVFLLLLLSVAGKTLIETDVDCRQDFNFVIVFT